VKQSRVTIDIDGYVENPELTAIRAYHGLEQRADEVEVRVSSGGEGIHLIGWFHNRLTDAQKSVIRRTLGDDRKRVALDEFRGEVGHTTNVLWEPEAEFENVYDALDHISLTKHRRSVRQGGTA
jgi:hypothetical protein